MTASRTRVTYVGLHREPGTARSGCYWVYQRTPELQPKGSFSLVSAAIVTIRVSLVPTTGPWAGEGDERCDRRCRIR